jgi:Tol biopolymer transport system component
VAPTFFAMAPRWSPDGQQIAFAGDTDIGDVNSNIYYQPASGAKTAERLTKSENTQILDDWSGDGRFLVYSQQDPKTRNDLWVLPLSGERKPFPFLATQFDEKEGRFAPARNGVPPRWLAYTSDATGTYEVYVQSFPASATTVRISTNGGSQPRWRRDGKELFYLAADETIMAVPVNIAAGGFQVEAPAALCRPSFAAAGSKSVPTAGDS